jgi:hypothetical protein
MLRLAGMGTLPTLGSVATDARAGLPQRSSVSTDGSWRELAIARRSGHCAIYDPVRDRMVVFGGRNDAGYRTDTWTLSLAGTPAWTQLTPTGTPPFTLYAQAIYDPVRDRMVVFGGYTGFYLNRVWALSLAGTPAWTELAPGGTPPSGREHHSALYDPVRDRMLVFGGNNGSSYFNDVWALSLAGTPAWTQLTPAGTPPSGRTFQSAIYDPVRDRMVVFDGHDGSSFLNDVWALSLAGTPTWTALTPTGTPPSARFGHGAIYDALGDRMVVFGGYELDIGLVGDAWALSLAGTPGWTELTPSGTPPSARYLQSAIYDPVRDHMVVFAGYNGYDDEDLQDVWALSLAGAPAWTELTSSRAPSSGYGAIYDPVRDRVEVLEGSSLWALSLSGSPIWTEQTPTGTPPSARYGESAIYDPVRDRIVVFGGYDVGYRNDVWALSLAGTPAWTQLTPTGTPPSGRSGHTAIYDPLRDRMVVFGGYALGYPNDVWALSLAGTPAWTQLTPTTPSGGGGPAIYDVAGDRMVVFGGYDTALNGVWGLSLAGSPAWTALTPGGSPPSARYGHSAIYDPVRDRMVIFGGHDDFGAHYFNDVWELPLAGPLTWRALTPDGTAVWNLPFSHNAIYDPVRDRMVVFIVVAGGPTLWALEWGGVTGVGGHVPPLSYLHPPAPNPFHGATTVTYSIAQAGRVRLGVYDARGRLVRRLVDGDQRAGRRTVVWDGADESGSRLGAGVYLVRLAGAGNHVTRKVVFLR